MPTYMTVRPYASEKELEQGAARMKTALGTLGIVKRMMTYIFEVPGQGLVTASCFEAPDESALLEMQKIANLPEAMLRPVRLHRSEGAGVHAHPQKSLVTYVVNRGKVCAPDEVETIGQRSLDAEIQMGDGLKRMEAWLYDDEDQVAMLSVYQAKSVKAIHQHARLAGLPVIDIYKARIAP
ncbi:MAG: hypothetical protein O2868_02315 [Proteobacteria bacterium]|jgi:hypothetical protein|nr:hypothetical protein [Pseudomonadota bacterium]